MGINAENPLIVEKVEAQVFDVLWVTRFAVIATDPNERVQAFANIHKVALKDGTYKMAPEVDGASCKLEIPDLFKLCAEDMTPRTMKTFGGAGPDAQVIIADIMQVLLETFKHMAEEKKLI